MSKYSTHTKFLEFERLFGSPAVDDLLQRIVEAQAEYGDRGGDGIRLSVTETSIGCYDLSGYLDYAGQEMTFELSWGHGHGTEVTDFDFDADEVLATRQQVLSNAVRDMPLSSLLREVLEHPVPALLESGLELTPDLATARLSMVFDSRRAAVAMSGLIRDPGLEASYPCIAQCELMFQGETCSLTLGLAALHADDGDDVELMHWASAFAAVNLVSHEAKLGSTGLLDLEPAVRKLASPWSALMTEKAPDGSSHLANLERQFAGKLLEACTP